MTYKQSSNCNLFEDLVENLSIWMGKTKEEVMGVWTGQDFQNRDEIEKSLDHIAIGRFEWLVRRLSHRLSLLLSEEYRSIFFDNLKYIRQIFRKDMIEISQCELIQLDQKLRNIFKIPPMDWGGVKGIVCLTHDIDTATCYEQIPKVIELEKHYGVRSSFNFLTHGNYTVDRKFVSQLHSEKFEIGLHGYTHDIAIGTRHPDRIKREISLAMEKLDFPVRGYRAPAFAVSKVLLKILSEIGVKYDSSVKVISCYGKATEINYPYRYPGIDIWEVPLLIQDDRVFRDLHLSNEEGLGVIKELTSRVTDLHGVAVINTHPKLIKEKRLFYPMFLEWLSQQKDIRILTIGEVVDIMEQKRQKVSRLEKGESSNTEIT